MGVWGDIKKSFSHNHTLQFLFDPVKPVEKIASTGYKDVKSVTGYVGTHVVQDVDNLSSSISNTLPFIIGGVVVVYLFSQRR